MPRACRSSVASSRRLGFLPQSPRVRPQVRVGKIIAQQQDTPAGNEGLCRRAIAPVRVKGFLPEGHEERPGSAARAAQAHHSVGQGGIPWGTLGGLPNPDTGPAAAAPCFKVEGAQRSGPASEG
jgi:hypothetical protein